MSPFIEALLSPLSFSSLEVLEPIFDDVVQLLSGSSCSCQCRLSECQCLSVCVSSSQVLSVQWLLHAMISKSESAPAIGKH